MTVKIGMLTRNSYQSDPTDSDERERLWAVYEANIPLFWRCRERIAADLRLFFAQTPFKVHAAYIDFPHSGPYPLGVIVRAWMEHETVYRLPCPKCGDKMLIYSFAGSPLSGRSSRSACCVKCGYRVRGEHNGNFSGMFGPMRRIAMEYDGTDCREALTLEEVVGYIGSL